MIFGDSALFAIEAFHEPADAHWVGFGRIAIDIAGSRIGDITDRHCALFSPTQQLRRVAAAGTDLWDPSFAGFTDDEIFAVIDRGLYGIVDWLYVGDSFDEETVQAGIKRYQRFDFLTNSAESFDHWKTFAICSPDARVRVLFENRDRCVHAATRDLAHFRGAFDSFWQWRKREAPQLVEDIERKPRA